MVTVFHEPTGANTMRNFFAYYDRTETIIISAMALVMVAVIGVAAVTVVNYNAEKSACVASGKAWTLTGSHMATLLIPVGKVMVPTQTIVNEYTCTK
jgi:hypothetical protein